jgi:endonuclease/exonuclease/phosphatase family metal-dependent hydrolase
MRVLLLFQAVALASQPRGMPFLRPPFAWILVLLTLPVQAEVVRVATYNVENYLDVPTESRHVKPPEARAMVVESIVALKPDVIALEEMGSTNALMELQSALAARGVNLPHWEWVRGVDTNIQVAILSRFELTARRPHTNEAYLLNGRRFKVSRGIADVDVRVNERFQFTLMAAHLKSRRSSLLADETEMREQEALRIRALIDERLSTTPFLVLAGDLNDSQNSKAVRAIIGNGKTTLFDTHPAERDCSGKIGTPTTLKRLAAWTYYYASEDTYSRIDFILPSPAMKARWLPQESYVLSLPDWGTASDHRPLVCGFEAP